MSEYDAEHDSGTYRNWRGQTLVGCADCETLYSPVRSECPACESSDLK